MLIDFKIAENVFIQMNAPCVWTGFSPNDQQEHRPMMNNIHCRQCICLMVY